MKVKCKICGCVFNWERPPQGGHQPKICKNPDCFKARNRLNYLKWKEANPLKKKRKKAQPTYLSRAAPKPKQWPCKICGKMSSGRINCPTCLHKLSKMIVSDEFIFCDSGELLTERFEESVR